MPETRTIALALPPCPTCQRPALRFTGVSHAPQQLTIAVRCVACD